MITTIIEPTTISVAAARPTDVTLSLIFDPAAPLAALDVAVDAAIPATDDAGYLAVLDAAIARLQTYRDDYAAAADLLLVPSSPRFVGAWRRRIGATRSRTAPCPHCRHTAS